MVQEYQVTLVCGNGKYKPVSCIVKRDIDLVKKIGKEQYVKTIKELGIIKICQKRYWTSADLKKYGYTIVKVRRYDKERIEQDAKQRYEAIKEAKYESGEWQRPKNK